MAAHGTAGGGLPSGPTAAMLALLSITLGALVTTIRDAVDVRVLVAVLAVGQLLSHVLLGAGIIVVEGLNLRDVEPGVYEMFCLPLALVGADGAPARVVLCKS